MRFAKLQICLLLLLSMTGPLTLAQTQAVVEPEYSNTFFFLQPDGTLKSLERQNASISSKVHALGYGGAESVVQIENEHSDVRVGVNAPAIIVKLEDQSANPQDLLTIYPLLSQKGKRQLSLARSHFLTGAKSGTAGKEIPFTFVKYGKSSIKVTLGALAPGEYEISVHGTATANVVYCFGVDAAN